MFSKAYEGGCYIWDGPGRRPGRPRQWLPRREKWFWFRRDNHIWRLHWKPFSGIWLISEHLGHERSEPHTVTPRPEKRMPVKRKAPMGDQPGPQPAAKSTSVLLGKLPALREWLTATTYEDGSPRSPGKLSLEVYGTTWSLLLRDPDAAARLNVRGEELDKVLMIVEQLLGVEEAPWERDDWMASQLAKKSKKK